ALGRISRMSKRMLLLRSLAAPVVGYAVIVAGTSVSFYLAGGINLRSTPTHFILGTLGILVSGIAGGYAAGWLGGRNAVLHALAVLVFLIVDSTTVLFFRKRDDPLWFGLTTALGLMFATVAGGFVRSVFEA